MPGPPDTKERNVVGFACLAKIHYPRQKEWREWEANYDAAIKTILEENAKDFFLESPQIAGKKFSCILHQPSHAIQLATRLQLLTPCGSIYVGIGRGVEHDDLERKGFATSRNALLRAEKALETAFYRKPRTQAVFNGFDRWDSISSNTLSLVLSVRACWSGRQRKVATSVEEHGKYTSLKSNIEKPSEFHRIYRRAHLIELHAVELELRNLLDAYNVGHAIS